MKRSWLSQQTPQSTASSPRGRSGFQPVQASWMAAIGAADLEDPAGTFLTGLHRVRRRSVSCASSSERCCCSSSSSPERHVRRCEFGLSPEGDGYLWYYGVDDWRGLHSPGVRLSTLVCHPRIWNSAHPPVSRSAARQGVAPCAVCKWCPLRLGSCGLRAQRGGAVPDLVLSHVLHLRERLVRLPRSGERPNWRSTFKHYHWDISHY